MTAKVLFLLLATLGGVPKDPNASTRAPLGEDFRMKIGQQVIIKGQKVSIRFKGVDNESRCPTGVQCVWAGNAALVVEVAKKNKKTARATLNTNVQPNEVAYEGFKIRLVGLNPYPKIDQPIDPKDYEATLIVTKD